MEQVIQKWRRAIRRSDAFIHKAIVENQELILDLNIAQLEKGLDSFGNLLMEYASDEYAEFKQAIGSKAPFGIADLKLEGDFYSGFVLIADDDGFRITSTDEKTPDLAWKYGEGIFGLTEENQGTVNPEIGREFIKYFRHALL